VAARRARGGRQGRLREQGATDEQVERPAGHRRREEELRPAGDPRQGARQPARPPEHQHHQDVADHGLGDQRHEREHRHHRIGPGVAVARQRPQQRRRRAHLADQRALDHDQDGRHRRNRAYRNGPASRTMADRHRPASRTMGLPSRRISKITIR
jgi:hypothetical protein